MPALSDADEQPAMDLDQGDVTVAEMAHPVSADAGSATPSSDAEADDTSSSQPE